jgi:transglutaminase-like putative cysteine protease
MQWKPWWSPLVLFALISTETLAAGGDALADSAVEPRASDATQFDDPTFIDAAVRRRANYKIADFNGATRLLWLLADAITAPYRTDLDRVLALQKWVCGAVPHVGGMDLRGANDFYKIHALEIIRRGFANCEGTAETFAAMAWLAGYPSRVLSIQVEAPRQADVYGHHVNEVFLNGKWVFVDADYYRFFKLPDGSPANALDLHERPEIVVEAESRRPAFDGLLSFLNAPSIREIYTKKNLFHTIYVQEGIYSIDGEYGRWIKLTPKTRGYLYSGPRHPDVVRLLQTRLPYTYLRDSTKIDDHFHYRWEAPWGR